MGEEKWSVSCWAELVRSPRACIEGEGGRERDRAITVLGKETER